MSNQLQQHLSALAIDGRFEMLNALQHGIEKEGLRVASDGRLSQQAHPQGLGSALTNSRITTDYSEALLEFITPVFDDVEQAIVFLQDLHRFTYRRLDGEAIWASSMPCQLSGPEEVPIARYGDSNIGRMKYVYRVGLENRYGKMMQTIAGIHYNFSLPDNFWPIYQSICGDTGNTKNFQSASYFALIRNFRRYSWLLIYLFGASPALNRSFMGDDPRLQRLGDDTLYSPYATSLRMSDLGYTNQAQESLNVCYNHLDSYVNTLTEAIGKPYPAYEKLGVKVGDEYRQLNSNLLQIENEYYSDIRPKRVANSGEKPVRALQLRGVEYVEVRNMDINPYLAVGIDVPQARFIDTFLVYCLLSESPDINGVECDRIKANHHDVVWRGRAPELQLATAAGQKPLKKWASELLAQMMPVADLLDRAHGHREYSKAMAAQGDKILNPELTPSGLILREMQEQGLSYDEFAMRYSVQHQQQLSSQELTAGRCKEFDQQAAESLLKQAQMEQQSDLDFDQFLTAYFKQ